MRLCYRYRSALIWQDKTVYYFKDILSGSKVSVGDECGYLGLFPGTTYVSVCRDEVGRYRKYMCQTPRGRKQQHFSDGDGSDDTVQGYRPESMSRSASQHTWPSLAPVNVTVLGQHRQQWSMVTCPTGHVTHAFLACDVSTSCWAEGDAIFSLQPETWALPTSQSCPAPLTMTSLPPSFPCDSDEWRVPFSLVCDHLRDCLDGSDETFCKFTPCSWQSLFQCQSKQV